jgi:hypothetical protein
MLHSCNASAKHASARSAPSTSKSATGKSDVRPPHEGAIAGVSVNENGLGFCAPTTTPHSVIAGKTQAVNRSAMKEGCTAPRNSPHRRSLI